MATVMPNQFAVGKNRIIHKPTSATFSFDAGHTTFKSINWGRADEHLSSGMAYRKDDIIRVAQQLLSKLPQTIRLRQSGRPEGWGYFRMSRTTLECCNKILRHVVTPLHDRIELASGYNRSPASRSGSSNESACYCRLRADAIPA